MPDELRFSDQALAIKPGIYEHYKGNRYRVIGVAHHSEDLSELVIYEALYGDRLLWVRPVQMFGETVEYEGVVKPRFRYISETEESTV